MVATVLERDFMVGTPEPMRVFLCSPRGDSQLANWGE